MRRSFRRRAAPLLAGLAVLACAGVAGGQAREGFAPGQDVPAAYGLTPFYEPPGDLRRFRPGDVIRTEAVPAPAGQSRFPPTSCKGKRSPCECLPEMPPPPIA